MAKKILIVDDAVFMRMMLKGILEPYGYEVVGEAEDGDKAVELFKLMTNMGGIESLREIKNIDKKAKVVVISAVDQRKALLETIRLGASDFIVKPFEEERVLSAVKKALEK
ncbi:MAG: response regulator [Nitrospinae bacterium]|nr:response regulator [Nitrospinota bacterium]